MPNRLVYTPKAYVFTKAQDGTLYNLTPYVTQGEVQLNTNKVSSAAITLRNPYRIFTTPAAGVAFHPMDPVTIYLERIAKYPVRVFTGYLDTTPYYQLQPGTIQLQASCTLKRLLYTYFDPSLPYMIAFFSKYGWINTGSGSIISSATFSNPTAGNNQQQVTKNPTTLNDGSLAKLLWAVLYDIGQWDDSKIWIEPIPNGIVQRMQDLMTSMQLTEQAAANYFSQFLTAIVGTGGQGSGGGTAGGATTVFTGGPLASSSGLTVKGSPMNATQLHFANMILATGQQKGASALACQVVMLQAICESGIGVDMTWNPTYGGLLAGNVNTFGRLGADTSDAVAQAEINSAFTGGNGYNYPGGALAATGSDIMAIAERNAGCGNQYTQESGYSPNWIQEAINIVAAGQKNNGTTGTINIGTGKPIKTTKNQPGGSVTQAGHTAPSLAINTTYVNPFAKATGVVGERYDQGVDYRCTPGSPIVALGDCTYDGIDPGWYQGQPLITFVLTSGPLTGCRFYYAEGIKPPTYPQGTKFHAGEVVTTTTSQPTGLEFGWASNTPNSTATYAQSQGASGDTDSISLDASHMWGRLMKILGAPLSSGGDPGSGSVAPNGHSGAGITAGSASGSGGSTGNTTGVLGNASAEAFTAQVSFPSIEDQVAAVILGGEGKGLMHDQSLMPFIQQICQASLRSFMSLPNGDFFAFYPDYFGEMGHRNPYWFIDDLEILSGTIGLTDDALATHVFAVGDNTMIDVLGGQGSGNTELLNQMFSAGTISVFNAFLSEGVIQTGTGAKKTASSPTNGLADVMNAKEAEDFVKRYGARPLVQNYPQIRSSIFEMLMAYQLFMTAWANQFLTPFTFTFMPELFPGGKVGFPKHGLQMYINQVTHSWDYDQTGFTTTAQLSAPSLLQGHGAANPDLPPNMVAAMAEPVKQKRPSGNAAALEGAAATLADTIQNPQQPQPNPLMTPTDPPIETTNPFLDPLSPII